MVVGLKERAPRQRGPPRLRTGAGLELVAANRKAIAVDLNLGRRTTRRGSGRDGAGRSDSRQGEHQKNELLAHDSPPSGKRVPATGRPLSSPYPTPVAPAQVQRETGCYDSGGTLLEELEEPVLIISYRLFGIWDPLPKIRSRPGKFWPLPELYRAGQKKRAAPRILRRAAEDSSDRQRIPAPQRRFRRLAENSGASRKIPETSGILQRLPENSRTPGNLPACAGKYGGARESSAACRKIPGRAGRFCAPPNFSGARQKILGDAVRFRRALEDSGSLWKILPAARIFCEAALNSVRRRNSPADAGAFSKTRRISASQRSIPRRAGNLGKAFEAPVALRGIRSRSRESGKTRSASVRPTRIPWHADKFCERPPFSALRRHGAHGVVLYARGRIGPALDFFTRRVRARQSPRSGLGRNHRRPRRCDGQELQRSRSPAHPV